MNERRTRVVVGTIFILLALAMIAGIVSCSPERKAIIKKEKANKKLAKLLSEYPDLVKKDTVWMLDTTTVPQKKASATADLKPVENDQKLDTLIDSLAAAPKEERKEKIKYIKEYIIKKMLPDTTIVKDGITFNFSGKNGAIDIGIIIPEQKIPNKRPVAINSVEPLKITQEESDHPWKWYFWILAAIVALFCLYKIFK